MEVEDEREKHREAGSTPLELRPSADRSKTAQRLRYEAEVSVIRKKLGGLEDIRKTLNLTQRKMAQLLLVDPSAWTRWTKKEGEGAPPHIYRMLQWYLALEDKYPALDTKFWLSTVAHLRTEESAEKFERQTVEMKKSLESMRAELENFRITAQKPVAARTEPVNVNANSHSKFWVGILIAAAFFLGLLVRHVF